MVGDQDVKPAKLPNGCADECLRGINGTEVAGNGRALRTAAFLDQPFRLFSSPLIIEHDPRAGFDEHPDGGCSNAARSTGNQRNSAIER